MGNRVQAEAKDLEKEILTLVRELAPGLLDLLGVGPITAAQILVSWSHQGRFRSEEPSRPLPASRRSSLPPGSPTGIGSTAGDRQLNRAMHTITLIRMRLDPTVKAYVARRITEGKTSSRDAQRCLKRAICRQIFKILEQADRTTTGSVVELTQAA